MTSLVSATMHCHGFSVLFSKLCSFTDHGCFLIMAALLIIGERVAVLIYLCVISPKSSLKS